MVNSQNVTWHGIDTVNDTCVTENYSLHYQALQKSRNVETVCQTKNEIKITS